MSAVLRALAPAKINLGLFVGAPRAGDDRHELVTVMQSISLADELTLELAPAGSAAEDTLHRGQAGEQDEVACPGVPGPPADNLAAALKQASFASIVVTDEVGSGIVPTDHAESRRFRDLLGWTNQKIAAVADQVLLMVAGYPLKVK